MSNENDPPKQPFIFIVDDMEENHMVIGHILRKEGYKVASAYNGVQALEMLKNILPDLILLDVMMPEMNGFDFCHELKKSPSREEIPVIFITGQSEIEQILRGFTVGAVDYVLKPFNPAELLVRVKNHLKLKHALDRERKLITELRSALDKVDVLNGMLPICSKCKKIRDDKGYWSQVEEYISAHSDIQFSHSLCPSCLESLYPHIADKIMKTRSLG